MLRLIAWKYHYSRKIALFMLDRAFPKRDSAICESYVEVNYTYIDMLLVSKKVWLFSSNSTTTPEG